MTGTLPSSSSSFSRALEVGAEVEVASDDVDSFETSDDRGFVRFLMTKAGASSSSCILVELRPNRGQPCVEQRTESCREFAVASTQLSLAANPQ